MAKRKPNQGRPAVAGKQPGIHIPTSNGEILLTRRHFLYGAAGVGAVALLAGGVAFASNALKDDSQEEISVLAVPAASVFTLDDCSEVPAADHMRIVGEFELPYGTLVWANSENVAACLLPTETAQPLTKVGLLFLGSGNCTTVLDGAVEQAAGFDVYDVRANDQGLVWVEANILTGIWHLYSATFNGTNVGKAVKVAEGDGDWEVPAIAAVGGYAYWQKLPVATGPKSTEDSVLYRAEFGGSDSQAVYTSHGRMSTPLYALDDSLVATPRTNTDTINYQLTLIDAASGEVRDKLVLPKSMKPLEAGYGKSGFSFSFDGTYDYGDGLSQLGTYTPATADASQPSGGAPWFRFGTDPTAPAAWCGDYFMVKGDKSVFGMSLADKAYFKLDVRSGADKYGDYLASTGTKNSVVTYANVDDKPINGENLKCTLVRVWAPVA